MEFDLTEAVVKEIELRTPYKVVASEEADTVLHGTIVSVSQRRISRNRQGGLPQDMELRLVIDFEWKDQRSGRTLRQRKGFESVGRYIPASGIGEPLEIAQHQAVRRLAEQMVSAMAGEW